MSTNQDADLVAELRDAQSTFAAYFSTADLLRRSADAIERLSAPLEVTDAMHQLIRVALVPFMRSRSSGYIDDAAKAILAVLTERKA